MVCLKASFNGNYERLLILFWQTFCVVIYCYKMGKHKKVVNNDPILQRDYKYEKRKKERAEEREAQRLRDL